MARGRKPAKRVKIEIQIDMSDAAWNGLKPNLHQIVSEQIAFNGKLTYLAIEVGEQD